QDKPTLKSLMKAIRESKEELTGHINQKTEHIQQSLTKIEQSLSTLAEQVQEMETRIGANEDNLSDAQARILKMEKEITFLKEKSEGTDMVGYVERLIPRLLGEDHFPTPVTIERAHRLGRATDRTRPILVKFLNFRDKDKVLRSARDKGTVLLDNNRVSFYPDYSIEVQRKMLAFNEVKKKVREKNIEYATRYPAKLRIRHGGGFKLFSAPSEVETFLSSVQDEEQS
uniref:L1 transposable element RRM domain-containing protein n=1 Tax=Poecilia formosa TaxID=48698 RepID=A0A087X5T4_POEFO